VEQSGKRRVHEPRGSDLLAGGWDDWLYCTRAVWTRLSGGRNYIREWRPPCDSSQPGDRGHSFVTCAPLSRVGHRSVASFDSCAVRPVAKGKPEVSAKVALRRCRRHTLGCGRGYSVSLAVRAFETGDGLRATWGLHRGTDAAERLWSGRSSHFLQGDLGTLIFGSHSFQDFRVLPNP
jgi:hypothetical protein